MSSNVQPLHRFTTSRKMLLDTLLIDKDTHRPAFATLTHDAVTSLYRVDSTGCLSDVGEVHWDPRGGQEHTVSFHARTMPVNEFLGRSRGVFSGSSHVFSVGRSTCRWREFQDYANSVYTLKSWVCHDVTSPSQVSPPALVAVLSPPQAGALKAEVTVYARGRDVVDAVVFSGILVSMGKAEWRSLRSVYTRHSLEHALKAEAQKLLARPCAAVAGSQGRWDSPSAGPYRPNTTPVVPLRSDMRCEAVSAPPPYTSQADISTPFH